MILRMKDLTLLREIEVEIDNCDFISRKNKIEYQNKIKKVPATIKMFKKEYSSEYDEIKRSEPINNLIDSLLEIQKLKSDLLKKLWSKKENSISDFYGHVIV